MLKAFLVSILSFVMVFVCQTNSWAGIENSTKFADVIALENPNITENESDRVEIRAKQSKINLLGVAWIPSFIIPGLGQILMGEFVSGFFYMILLFPHKNSLFNTTISMLDINLSVKTKDGFINWNGLIASIIYCVLYSINMINAFNLSYKKVSEEKEKAKELSFIRNNIRISNNGLEVKVFSF